ncbi:osteoclast-associated immunoglobulin-like receptor isoform X2 [Pogoniulus pusillus]|uniref:osteoclast-associated immunoglobulin-like receptor isoform X2 n=1 Tax=Pogoniulus pusillus TaxID=488313 RepID=UPI0030B93158
MLLVAQVLAFGACLVTQSKAAPSAPSVSIFLKPPGVISPGGSTTICCSCQCANGHFVLYKNGHRLRALELPGSRAEFTLSNASWGDAGVYSCQYLAGGSLLALSEGLDVVVQELLLPAPALSVLPGPEVGAGAAVALRCSAALPGARCLLYREGQRRALDVLSQHQEAFSISHAREGDGGRYSCQCFTQAAAIFNWSAASQPLELVVRDYTWSNIVHLALGAGVLALLGLILAEATHSSWRERHQPCP